MIQKARLNDQRKIKVIDDNTVICEFEAVETDTVAGTVDFITKQIKLDATSSTPYADIVDLAEVAIANWIN